MPSPDVLEFDRLLTAVSDEAPAGPDPRASTETLYRLIKEARARVRQIERESAMSGESTGDVDSEWRTIWDNGREMIATQAKDYEVTAWLIESAVRFHGFAGLRDGLRLARELAEQYWDQLHPQPDEEEGYLARMMPIQGLSGTDRDGTLVVPIRRTPVTSEGDEGAFSHADYIVAKELDQIEDVDRRNRRIEEGAVTMQQFERAAATTSPESFATTLEDIEGSLEELSRLDEIYSERCPPTTGGEMVAPNLANLREALRECEQTIRLFHTTPESAESGDDAAAGAEAGGAETPVAGGGAGITAHVNSREEAFNTLLRIAEYFRKTEPHSPVPYALERVVRWGRMPLPSLLSELIRDESGREQLFRLVGIPHEEDESNE